MALLSEPAARSAAATRRERLERALSALQTALSRRRQAGQDESFVDDDEAPVDRPLPCRRATGLGEGELAVLAERVERLLRSE